MENNQKLDFNPQFKKAYRLMEETRENVFVTGKAGTGKSTLLSYFCQNTQKNIAVLAPTGVAAVNIKGETIHSFFGFRPNITVEKVRQEYRGRDKKGLYKKLDSIVIDEVSMVRADLLDCVDVFLRLNGPDRAFPFGGVQIILIGDLYQLPPVVTSKERLIFKSVYDTPYFFSAHVFKDVDLKMVELRKIYRQKDEVFIKILNSVSNRSVTREDLEIINKRYDPHFEKDKDDFYIYLTPTNRKADMINKSQLASIRAAPFKNRGEIEGKFDAHNLPAPLYLEVKVGAQVMLVNNDRGKRWINGTVGKIVVIEKSKKKDQPAIMVEISNGKIVSVLPYTWEMYRYRLDADTGKIDSEVVGSFSQYPLILAWAVTIHKSQGKTFDKVILDLDRGTFTHGQSYVALSRCTSLSGLILKKPLELKHILMDFRVVKFLTSFQYKQAERKISFEEKVQVITSAIENKQKLKIVYLKSNNDRSRRVLEPKRVGKEEYMGKSFTGVRGYCFKRQDVRVFRVDRILRLEVIGRKR